MRARPVQVPWKSFEYIDRCLSIYFAQLNEPYYIPGYHKPSQFRISNGTNVILFGDVASALEVEYLRLPETFRIWVLCKKFRRFLIDQLRLDNDHVGVLPRTIFLQDQSFLKVRPSIRGFVFAGRAELPTKRLGLAIALIEAIRSTAGSSYYFAVCVAGCAEEETLRRAFPISRFPWLQFYFGLGNNWVEKFPDAVFISLSQFEFEDLGVAACEAQNSGMRCVLSDWGGHSDFDSPNVLKLSVPMGWGRGAERSYVEQNADQVLQFVKSNSTVNTCGTATLSRLPEMMYRGPFRALVRTRSLTPVTPDFSLMQTGRLCNLDPRFS
jgi:hypothetical protein